MGTGFCKRCQAVTPHMRGQCGHLKCAECGRCPMCDDPVREGRMSTLDDRKRWLDHLQDCTLCPTSPCDRGLELAAAVRDSIAPGEEWEGVWAASDGR